MTSAPPETLSPNKPALVFATACGATLGLLPYLLLIERPAWTALVASGAALIAYFSIRKQGSNATASPTLGEWLFASWGTAGGAAGVSLMGLLVYGALYWGIRWGGQLFGMDAIAAATTWGERTSGTLVALAFIGTVPRAATALASKLYPQVSGTRSPFFALAENPTKWIWVAVLGLAALVAAVVAFDLRDAIVAVLLALFLFYSGFPLSMAGEERKLRAEGSHAEAIVRKMFESSGFEILAAPVVGDGDVLSGEVDFLARGEGRVFAVEVKRQEAGVPPAEWSMAIPLRSAAHIVQERLAEGEGAAPQVVRPCLVLVGGRVDDSLRAFALNEDVTLVHLPDDFPISTDAATIETLALFASQLGARPQPATTADPHPEAG